MKVDNYLDRMIAEKLVEANRKERESHVCSGRLTASMLGDPLQWQILKSLGVPPKPVEEYVLRKFKRGDDVEAWIVEESEPIATQEIGSYRGVTGLIDAMMDTAKWDFPCGIIPVEVKSVTNAKYKRIMKAMKPDRGHMLQACCYALMKMTAQFAVAYIASDDYRLWVTIHDTAEWKPQVDEVISRFIRQKEMKKVPVFVPEEKWQANPQYQKYPDWAGLDEKQIEQKLSDLKINHG